MHRFFDDGGMHPFEHTQLIQLAQQHGTPLWVYDAATVRRRIQALKPFDTIRYAQKANANTHLLRLMRQAGVVVDAVSVGEIESALAAGYASADSDGHDIVFTADVLEPAALDAVVRHRIPVNAGSITMLDQLGERAPGHPVWLRINPGFGHGHSRKTNTGGENSKHGIWHTDLPLAVQAVQRHGLRLSGLHMHIGSGADYAHLQSVCAAMVEAVKRADMPIEAISAGGGLPVPYRDSDARIDIAHYIGLWNAARRELESHLGQPLRLEIEPGRYLVADSGVLLTRVCATKHMGSRRFALVDAGFSDLMRPTLYGSFHAISVLPSDDRPRPTVATVVAGPLCESGDVFTQTDGGLVEPRDLPETCVGDLLVVHDTGAYGASMSSNYNSRPLIAEVLVDGEAHRLIRRRQTMAELLALEAV